MIAIIDYGVGNLFSLKSSFSAIEKEAVITADETVIRSAERLILPGVGAFGDAAKKLKESGLFSLLKEEAERGKPLMGICLGMQLLFEKSFEYGEHEGLSLLKGEIVPIKGVVDERLKIPHIGWNPLIFKKPSPLFRYISEGDCVYFVHSYYASRCEDTTIAVAEYSVPLTAAAQKNNVVGCQFHPEKSGEVGLKILRAFCQL